MVIARPWSSMRMFSATSKVSKHGAIPVLAKTLATTAQKPLPSSWHPETFTDKSKGEASASPRQLGAVMTGMLEHPPRGGPVPGCSAGRFDAHHMRRRRGDRHRLTRGLVHGRIRVVHELLRDLLSGDADRTRQPGSQGVRRA
jgi:hypothetical protein